MTKPRVLRRTNKKIPRNKVKHIKENHLKKYSRMDEQNKKQLE